MRAISGARKPRRGTARGSLYAFVCLSVLAASPSWAQQAEVSFDTSRLPRVSGAKEIYASPAVTSFTSPDSVAQTADAVDKTLAAGGWQKYEAPFSSTTTDPNIRIMSLKKGTQALNVFITVAPAQNNATSVQYSALALKTDLPFIKDADNIEYSPDRPLLTFVTEEPADKLLDFYRKELGDRGWALWSDRLSAKQPAGGPAGVIHLRGAYAHYVSDKEPTVVLVLTAQNTDAGKLKVELKEWPIGILKTGTPPADGDAVDVRRLPRLDGAQENVARSTSTNLRYDIAGSVPDATAAVRTLFSAEGWKQFASPSDDAQSTLIFFKKGSLGATVSFSMSGGKADRSIVYYSPHRIYVDLPVPDAATDVVFDEYRPYLNFVTTGTAAATLDVIQKELGAAGWVPLTADAAAAQWPDAKLDDKPYYIRQKQKPIVLSAVDSGDGKVKVEIKVAPFAEPQNLEADQEIFGLPSPKPHKTAGGTGGQTQHEMHAMVQAGVEAVLAFYRRELAAKSWKEEPQGAVVKPEQVTLNFTTTDGTAVLKLGRKYDLTLVSLVQQLPKPVARPESKSDSIDDVMKQAQQMMRDATSDMMRGTKAPRVAQSEPAETLRPQSGTDSPVPVPDTAEDVDFSGGKLEFNSPSSVKSVAEFYRAIMKQQGWQSQSSVINSANMVVLNFSKAGKSVSFTVMRMGPKTNVTADGSALKVAAAKAGGSSDRTPAARETVKAMADDLEAEQSGGLPVPKRHTMTDGTQTPFRRDLKAKVPLELSDVLGFYRRELGKLRWKEEQKGASIGADKAILAFSTADGPALLTLGRDSDETTVDLVVKNPDAAAKAGAMPKPGQAKLLVSNPNDVEATITINKRTSKVAPGAGMKGPDGLIIDLKPGKYKVSVKFAGQPAHDDEVQVGADQTWGLLLGPGGALPLLVY